MRCILPPAAAPSFDLDQTLGLRRRGGNPRNAPGTNQNKGLPLLALPTRHLAKQGLLSAYFCLDDNAIVLLILIETCENGLSGPGTSNAGEKGHRLLYR